MREHLFRGFYPFKYGAEKVFINGEWITGKWVYGSLIQAENYCCILESEDKVHPSEYPYLNGESGTFDGYATPVIPETVGEFTGLTDKNGTKIFEGDILRLGTGKIRYVFYAAPRFKHTMYNEYAKEFDYKDKGYEVIGNIHSNPELLEVKK